MNKKLVLFIIIALSKADTNLAVDEASQDPGNILTIFASV